MESTDSNQPKSSQINHVAISVTNLEQAVSWYQKVLGFKLIGGPHNGTRMTVCIYL